MLARPFGQIWFEFEVDLLFLEERTAEEDVEFRDRVWLSLQGKVVQSRLVVGDVGEGISYFVIESCVRQCYRNELPRA